MAAVKMPILEETRTHGGQGHPKNSQNPKNAKKNGAKKVHAAARFDLANYRLAVQRHSLRPIRQLYYSNEFLFKCISFYVCKYFCPTQELS